MKKVYLPISSVPSITNSPVDSFNEIPLGSVEYVMKLIIGYDITVSQVWITFAFCGLNVKLVP